MDGLLRRHGLKKGAIAGLIAGAVLSMFMAVTSLVTGQDVWAGAKTAGYPFLGERAVQPGFAFWPVLVGFASHLAVSAAWGALFGSIAIGTSRGTTLALGALWGIVVWLGMFYVILPVVGAAHLVQGMPISFAVIEHVIFGLAVAVAFLPYQRQVPPPPPRLPKEELEEISAPL